MNKKKNEATHDCQPVKEVTFKIGALKISSNEDQELNNKDGQIASDHFGDAEASLLAKIIKKCSEDSNNNIERSNPNSPLYSTKSFDALNLNPNLLKGVYEMGFNAPSKIQESALPTLLADPPQNLIAQSQTGTGKTATFVLAMLSRVDTSLKYPQVLCLSSTYELAIETGQVAACMAKFCPKIYMKYAVKGMKLGKGSKLTEHIIFGTPGKVLDWAVNCQAFDLGKISVFVLGQADVMLAPRGHRNQFKKIYKKLKQSCQMIFFSATYDQVSMKFAHDIVKNPITIRLKAEEESLDYISQYYIKCADQQEKYGVLTTIYEAVCIGRAIIFCDTKTTASSLFENMTKDGHAVDVLSGDLSVKKRMKALNNFKRGVGKVLITTDILSRGIDVKQVTTVVNFDLPMFGKKKADCETYLNRIGRTGRFGKPGIAINLVDSESSMQIYQDIERHFNRKIEHLKVDDAEKIVKIPN